MLKRTCVDVYNVSIVGDVAITVTTRTGVPADSGPKLLYAITKKRFREKFQRAVDGLRKKMV